MNELIFLVEENSKGGYSARGMGRFIVVERKTITGLKRAVVNAVRNCFGEGQLPTSVRFIITKEEIMAL